MKLRYIIIPLCIILYIWWSYIAITNWESAFVKKICAASFIGAISALWIVITSIALFSGTMFATVLFFDYCEEYW